MMDLESRIKNQIDLLTEEQFRVKKFLNESGFDCTSAAFLIAKRYRDELKNYIRLLRDNLEY